MACGDRSFQRVQDVELRGESRSGTGHAALDPRIEDRIARFAEPDIRRVKQQVRRRESLAEEVVPLGECCGEPLPHLRTPREVDTMAGRVSPIASSGMTGSTTLEYQGNQLR